MGLLNPPWWYPCSHSIFAPSAKYFSPFDLKSHDKGRGLRLGNGADPLFFAAFPFIFRRIEREESVSTSRRTGVTRREVKGGRSWKNGSPDAERGIPSSLRVTGINESLIPHAHPSRGKLWQSLLSLPGHAFRVTECPGVQDGLLEDILYFTLHAPPSQQSLAAAFPPSPLTTTLFPCQSGDTSGYACYAHKPQSFRPGCQERGYRKWDTGRERERDEALSLVA